MDSIVIREKLHQFIETTDTQRRKLIRAEREKYLTGVGRSYSPEEVRQMAMNKERK